MEVKLVMESAPKVPRIDTEFDEAIGNWMSAEEYIIWCARVSSTANRHSLDTGPKLLNYLMEHKHWSPFEMVNFGFQIKTSRAIAQQLLRHRSFSFQEFSQRYAEVEAMEPVEIRMQAEKNRQSSTVVVEDWDGAVEDFLERARHLYSAMLEDGVAKESARFILPMTTQTTLVMNGTFRSWIHFLEQRCDSHAQKEIREIAFVIRGMLAEEMPGCAEALGWGSADSGGET